MEMVDALGHPSSFLLIYQVQHLRLLVRSNIRVEESCFVAKGEVGFQSLMEAMQFMAYVCSRPADRKSVV